MRHVFLSAVLAFAFSHAAGAQTHVAEPAVNLGDTSFLDAIAGPGGVVEQIADGAHDGQIVGADGSAVGGAVNSISGLTHVAWVSKKSFLGAWYGAEVVVAAAYVNAGAKNTQGGFGDFTVGPLLQWPQRRLLGLPIDQRVLLDFDLPTGYYNRTQDVNLGRDAFSVHPYYAITAHPTTKIETSWRIHYLWNSANASPIISSGYKSTQAGQAIHFNATIGYNVTGNVWLGANAYYLSQITSGRIDGRGVVNSPESVAAIGPGMLYAKGRWLIFLNQYNEVAAKNRATGQKYIFRIARIF